MDENQTGNEKTQAEQFTASKEKPRWHKLIMALAAIGVLACVAVGLALINLTPDKMLQMTAIYASLSTATVSIAIAFIVGNVGEHGAQVIKTLLDKK